MDLSNDEGEDDESLVKEEDVQKFEPRGFAHKVRVALLGNEEDNEFDAMAHTGSDREDSARSTLRKMLWLPCGKTASVGTLAMIAFLGTIAVGDGAKVFWQSNMNAKVVSTFTPKFTLVMPPRVGKTFGTIPGVACRT